MPDVCNQLEASLRALQILLAENEETTEDCAQRLYELSIEFNLYHREADLTRIGTLRDDLTRLDAEYSDLVTRINYVCAKLEEI